MSEVKIKPHDALELKLLRDAGIDPSKWISVAQLVGLYKVTPELVATARQEGILPQPVSLGNGRGKDFYPREETLARWKPETHSETLLDEDKDRTLADLPNSASSELAVSRWTWGKPNPTQLERKLTQANYLTSMFAAVPLEDWQEIVREAVFQAKKGDHRARKWLGDYLVGTPIQRVAADLKVEDTRFSEVQRAQAIESMLMGVLNAGARDVEAIEPDSAEAD